MSSSFITGIVALSGGRRVSSHNSTTNRATSHIHYDSVLQTPNGNFPAEVRLWAAASSVILSDATIATFIGKLYAPANLPLQIDAVSLKPFPGDPNDEDYEDAVPDDPYPWLFVTGHTVGSAIRLEDGASTGYMLTASEWVREQTRMSSILLRFDANRPRWRNLVTLRPGTAVQIVGTAHGRNSEGFLAVDVQHLTLNIGASTTTAAAQSSAAATSTSTSPSGKHRRFAVAGPAAPQAASAGPSTADPTAAALAAGIALPPPPAASAVPVPSSSTAAAPATTRGRSGKSLGKRKAELIDDEAAEG